MPETHRHPVDLMFMWLFPAGTHYLLPLAGYQNLYFYSNNLRGDNNFNIAMNRMKAADITQLLYLFDMYLLCIL